MFWSCLFTQYACKERKVLVTHEHSARAIQRLIFFVRANQKFFTNEQRTSILIQSALIFTSIPTSRANARYIPSSPNFTLGSRRWALEIPVEFGKLPPAPIFCTRDPLSLLRQKPSEKYTNRKVSERIVFIYHNIFWIDT